MFVNKRASRCVALAACLAGLTSWANAETLPAGTQIQIRLRQTLSSFGSHTNDEVRALVIAPVAVAGKIVIPLGAELQGTVFDVRRVGMGFARESAWIQVTLDSIRMPDGRQIPVTGRVASVDNSREIVDAKDHIQGIRATASFSSVISGLAVSATAFDPMLLAWGLASSLATFRIPESEIIFPTGTEMHYALTAPLELSETYPPAVPTLPDSPQLNSVIRDLPYRTTTQTTNIPSDLTNLVFLGSEDAVRNAFDAAGWAQTDALNARSTYGTMRSIMENQGYREAPMSTLLLNGQPPRFTYSKTLNTFFSRHHLRIFPQDVTFENRRVWTSSSTHDTGIGFATAQKTFIHIIDENIDNERAKVVNDLILTGCVDGIEMVKRPWVPLDASNSTGDRLVTDGDAAVIKLNDCANPERADKPVIDNERGTRPSAPLRATRNTMLTLRNDLLRGNLVYQGYAGTKMAMKAMKKPDPSSDQPRAINYGGQQWQIVRGSEDLPKIPNAPKDPSEQRPSFQPEEPGPRNYETFLEFSVNFGYSRFGNERFSTQPLTLIVPFDDGSSFEFPTQATTALRPGWNVSIASTFNAHKHFAHETGFTWNKSKLDIGLETPISSDIIQHDADIRQFHYALLYHPRANGKRLRPYLAAGAGMQVVRLTDANEHGSRFLRYAFREVNILYAAFRLGQDPPLEGGAIFQGTLNYGGGIKYHLNHRVVLRADFRETLSPQPDFWTKSFETLRTMDSTDDIIIQPGELEKHGPMRHQRISLGVGITF